MESAALTVTVERVIKMVYVQISGPLTETRKLKSLLVYRD